MGGRASASSGGSSSAQQVTAESAYESYFEYENAQLMKEYSKTGRMPNTNIFGDKVSTDKKAQLKAEADYIQNHTSNTGENTLYRGMVMSESQARSFNVGDTFKVDSLTSTSTDQKLSSIYSNVENAYGVKNPVPVMVTYQQSGGIKGFRVSKSTPEIILPKGQNYKVTKNYMDKDGVVHIELYAKKGSNK